MSVAVAIPRWLWALFFLSGASGLIYEVVWVRMLTRVLGQTVWATATVLSAFMAGLALGSYLAGRGADRCRRPLLWYGLLEGGISLTALLSLWLPGWLLPLYRLLHDWAGASGIGLNAARVSVALVMLLLPTTLMGATLPLLCAFGVRGEGAFGRCVGRLYAWNTFGAVTGALATGFVLLGAFGETNTILAGVALNGIVVLGAFALGARRSIACQGLRLVTNVPPPACYPVRTRRLVCGCFAAAGFAALANEVVWARMLQLYQGPSIYAFSGMLAVVLAGIALGSSFGGRWVDRCSDPLRSLALIQLGIGLAGLVSLHLFEYGALTQPDLTTGRNVAMLLLAPVLLVGPMGLLWGVGFPFAARCSLSDPLAAGRSIGALYSWNTVGGIVGSLAAGFALIPSLGVSRAGAGLAILSSLLGLLLLAGHPSGFRQALGKRHGLLLAASVLLLLLSKDSYNRLLHRRMEQFYPDGFVLYRQREDAAGTTTAFGARGADPRAKQLWVNGEGMTALVVEAKLMAHLPLWLADDPHDILVICFGMGTTVRSAGRHEGIHISAVELLPGVLESFGYYHADGPALLRRPEVRTVVDDGRNFLALSAPSYDVITIDPPPPLYSAGAVNLYSRDFFLLCRQRLRPRGVMCLWVPPANESEIRMIMATFLSVFDHVTVWEGPSRHAEDRGFFLLGSPQPFRGIADKIRQGFREAVVVADLVEWGAECDRPEKILALQIAETSRLRALVANAAIITDDRPYTEFPLWRALFGWGGYHRKLNGPRLRQLLTSD